jgi:hypothetical protein
MTDTVHVVNVGSSQSFNVALAGGPSNPMYLLQGQEGYTSFGSASGGPVSISAGGLLASRRTRYLNSFNETNDAAVASTDLFLPWFDKASAGFCADTIHVTNPNSSTASVTITVAVGNSLNNQIPGGQGAYFSWGAGMIGGPIEVTSTLPVFASERINYMHSFSENNAIPAANVSDHVWLSWYDNASHEVMGDDIHVTNPYASDCYVNVSVPGVGSNGLYVPHGTDQAMHFGPSSLGGPVKIDVTNPGSCSGVLAFQRTIWNAFFSEVDGMPISNASTSLWFNWYDNASTGMAADNIHLTNPSGSAATVSVAIPGAATQHATVPAGGFAVVAFPVGTIGGPVSITSDFPILASERVQFYSSFHEVDSLGLP